MLIALPWLLAYAGDIYWHLWAKRQPYAKTLKAQYPTTGEWRLPRKEVIYVSLLGVVIVVMALLVG